MKRQIAATFERSPLRRPAFARLLAGYTIAGLGHQFSLIALLWFVLDLTNSGGALGLIVVSLQIPGLMTSSFFGRLLDRFQPRYILVFDNLLRGLFIATIPLLYWFGDLHLSAIVVLSILAGALNPATVVGVQMLLPDLVPDDELDRANALISFALNVPFFIGPAIAGLLVAWWGGPAVILIDAFAFLTMAAASWSLPDITRAPAAVSAAGSRRGFLGLGILLDYPSIVVITAVSLVFYFSYGPLEPALPIYARDTLGTGSTGYGLLWAGMGFGMMIGLLAVPAAAKIPSQGILFASIAILWGVFLLPLAFVDNLPLAIVLLALAGAAWAPYTTMKSTIIQRIAPPHVRGQVFGAQYMVLVAGSPAGAAAGGLLLDLVAAPVVIAVSAIACLIAGGGGLASPALRAVRREVAAALEPLPSTRTSTSEADA